MNRREAKKAVCLELGRFIYQNAVMMLEETPDRTRIREASLELAAELLRRGGAEQEAQEADERQLTIEQAIAEAEEVA